MKLMIFVFLFSLQAIASPVSFNAHVDFHSPAAQAPTEAQVREQICKQLLHLIGNLQDRAEGLRRLKS